MTKSEIYNKLNELFVEQNNLQAELDNLDYQTIKCSEAFMLGLELPYDLKDLHFTKQTKRDRLNEIENEIDELNSLKPEEDDIKIF